MKIACWLALCLAALPARAADLFMLDQQHGSIGFSVGYFGTFTCPGSFPRFKGKLLIDRAHPERTEITIEADATTVTVPWPDSDEWLRGPEFFDAAHHPDVRFFSESIHDLDPRHFQINGVLTIRGIMRPLTLDATLERRSADPVTGTETADFTATGTLSRADYGMTARRMMISEHVRLSIAARIELPSQTASAVAR